MRCCLGITRYAIFESVVAHAGGTAAGGTAAAAAAASSACYALTREHSQLIHLCLSGRGEEQFLVPLWERLERRENPAQAAARVLEEKGIQEMIQHVAIR
jgi:hypothetical protein